MKKPANAESSRSAETSSHIEVKPLYTPAELGGTEGAWEYDHQVGYPGEPPYTRGVQPTMYRGRLWTMRQYAGFGTAEETNSRFRYLLEHGQTGLSVAFDLPTQMGYDADDPQVAGEVGKVGVSISSLADLDQRLPHPRSRLGLGAGARVHVRRRDRLRRGRGGRRPERRRLRAAALVLLRRAFDAPRRGREVPRRPAHLGRRPARPLRRDA